MSNKEQQLIIVMDREFGSGARRIADLLGVQLQIPVFEKNIRNVSTGNSQCFRTNTAVFLTKT